MAYKKNYTRKKPEEKQKEIEELTATMSAKIESYFESKENIQEHLRFMSNFYHYSARNMALIDSQFMGAQVVGSFAFWKKRGVSVNRGEKGIKIFVPVPVKYFNNAVTPDGEPLWKQVKYATEHEKAKLERGEYQTKTTTFFNVGHVFEYTQTNAREKGLEVSEIFGRYHRDETIENKKEYMEALKKVAEKVGVEIVDTPPIELGTAKGAFFSELHMIGLNPRNTASENIPVLLHELAHAELHSKEKQEARDKPLETAEKEFQAEMVAYTVASYYGIDTESFSLSYLANWTQNASLEDKEQLLNGVCETSKKFIDILDEHFESQKEKQVEQSFEFEKPVFLVAYSDLSQATITTIHSKDLLLEKIKGTNGYEKLADISDAKEFIATFNTEMSENYFLYEQTDNKPKMVIQWSEHDRLQKNQLMGFGEGNALLSDLEAIHSKNEEMGYYKTRYHVLVPTENDVALLNVDRLDIGDGYYTSPYQQMISENVQIVENGKVSMGILEKRFENQLLTDMAVHTHEKANSELTIQKPMMMLHGFTDDFRDFGKLNNIDYGKLDVNEYKYTIAVPHNDELYLYSNQYEKGDYVSPLHQMEQDETFDKDVFAKLDKSWNQELAQQAPRGKKEAYKHETNEFER